MKDKNQYIYRVRLYNKEKDINIFDVLLLIPMDVANLVNALPFFKDINNGKEFTPIDVTSCPHYMWNIMKQGKPLHLIIDRRVLFTELTQDQIDLIVDWT